MTYVMQVCSDFRQARVSMINNRADATQVLHARPFVGVFQKSISKRFINFWRYKLMKWLQERTHLSETHPWIPPRGAFYGNAYAKLKCFDAPVVAYLQP